MRLVNNKEVERIINLIQIDNTCSSFVHFIVKLIFENKLQPDCAYSIYEIC